jgi:hypothetical protein
VQAKLILKEVKLSILEPKFINFPGPNNESVQASEQVLNA